MQADGSSFRVGAPGAGWVRDELGQCAAGEAKGPRATWQGPEEPSCLTQGLAW